MGELAAQRGMVGLPGARAEAWTSQPEHSVNSPALAHSGPLLKSHTNLGCWVQDR